MSEPTYTAEQVAVAARELRDLAGAGEERFTTHQVLSMLSDEIRLLHERGFTDQRIADLFTGIDIPVTADQVTDSTREPAEPR